MSTDRIENLYKNFGILADSKDKSEVSLHLILIATYLYAGVTAANCKALPMEESHCKQHTH
jgi:hypothetical protein